MNPWKVVLITVILSTIVSFFVSGIIHLLCLIIRYFTELKSAPQHAGVHGQEADRDIEIAVAIAAVKARLDHVK
jgi:hypothetical protein